MNAKRIKNLIIVMTLVCAFFASGITVFADEQPESTEKNENIIIYLDPGHDTTHVGASGFGLTEQEVNLAIARACKAELEKYEGVTVYIARDEACPYPGTGSVEDICRRVDDAAKVGADAYISLHNNAYNGYKNGAEIYFQNSSWKPKVGEDSYLLSLSIMNQLTALGLKNNGVQKRDTTVDERYEDGSISDYYAVSVATKEYGIVGIIVEHAYIDNYNDNINFLSTPEKLIALGAADAAGIANFYKLSKKTGENQTDDLDQTENIIESGAYYISSALNENMVLDISGGSLEVGANLQMYESNETLAQQFVIYVTGDVATISNVKSGHSLDIPWGAAYDFANVWQYLTNDTNAQKWQIVKNNDGTYTFLSMLDTRYALDVANPSCTNGTNVQLYTKDGTNTQNFYLTLVSEWESKKTEKEEAKEETKVTGIHTIKSALNQNMVLDVEWGSVASGANIQIYESNGTDAQKFNITYDANGYATLINEKSGKALDVQWGNAYNGANVWQYDSNGTNAQKWIVQDNGDGTYTFRSLINQKYVLDIQWGNAANCTNVQLYESNGTNAQKFYIN